MFDRLKPHFLNSFTALTAQLHPADVPADRDGPCREGATTPKTVQVLKDVNPAVLKQVVGMVVIPRVPADCHPDAGADFPDDFRHECRITGVQTLQIDGISNRPAPSR